MQRLVALQEMVPKTFRLYPVETYFYPAGGFCQQHNTDFCMEPGHAPNCIWWKNEWWYPFKGIGTYRLKTPISIKSAMPGTGHKLAYARIDAMKRTAWLTNVVLNERGFIIYADGDEPWKVEGNAIRQDENSFHSNEYPIDVDISGYNTLDVALYGIVAVLSGAFEFHLANPMFTVRYIPETPPEPATVEVYVYNRETEKPVGGALVQLLDGNRRVAGDYTKSDGRVSFHNIPGGVEGISYTLLVTKAGYDDYKDEAVVKPGTNSFNIPLNPKPSPPLPEWVPWLAVGAAVVVAGGVAMAAARRPAKPEIIVVR